MMSTQSGNGMGEWRFSDNGPGEMVKSHEEGGRETFRQKEESRNTRGDFFKITKSLWNGTALKDGKSQGEDGRNFCG